MQNVKLDINNPEFLNSLFELEKVEQQSLLKTLKKIHKMTWFELYSDKGLKWEAITGVKRIERAKLYTFRFSKKYRATAIREGDFLKVLTLHVDHDSAYQ